VSPTFDCLPGRVLWRLVVLLCLASPLLAHGQASPAPANNPFAANTSAPSDPSPGFSSARSFRPYSGERSRVPAMQPEFTDSSGFNWTQFFKSAAEIGTRFAEPRLFMNNGQGGMGGGSLFHAGSASGGLGDSFNLSSRGMNFDTKSAGLDLHLSVQTMFPNGFSPRAGGSSFAGSGWGGTGEGGLASPGGMGNLGGRDPQKGSGARVSLQLKF
jgi:hypothetical protein